MHFRIYILLFTVLLFSACKTKMVEEKDLNGNILKKYSVLKKDVSKKHGAYTAYYDSSELLENANYKDGKLDGERILYFQNGKIMSKEHYNMDNMEGAYENYYESGNIKQKGIYKNNQIADTWTNYYEQPANQIKESFTIKDGMINGLYKEYATNGTLIIEGNKIEVEVGLDFFDGKVTMFDSISKKPVMVFEFDKGKMIKKDSII